ncbi:unnamed protein product [Closterium sp. NIES-65]|nr:unnamed protein product [Closterium sp. NIES-65]
MRVSLLFRPLSPLILQPRPRRRKKVKKGKGKQLVKPAGTRFGTNYIALSSLVELRSTLSQMVLSEEFANWSAGARKKTADTFRGQIMDDAWWKNATYLAELLAIPFKVMRATDSSAKGMMGTIYDLMLQLTEDVNDKLEAGEKILPRAVATDIGKIVRRRWDESLACALHVVGRILNPANQEEGIFRNDMECTRIFKAFIARHYDGKTFTNKDGEERRASLVLQEGLTAFLTLEGSFGLPEAIADREAVKAGKQSMVAWWASRLHCCTASRLLCCSAALLHCCSAALLHLFSCGKRGMGVEVQMRGDGQRPDEKLWGDGRRPDEKLRGDGRRPDEKLRGDGRRPDEKLRGDGRRPDEELRGDGRRPDEKLRGDGRRPDEKR